MAMFARMVDDDDDDCENHAARCCMHMPCIRTYCDTYVRTYVRTDTRVFIVRVALVRALAIGDVACTIASLCTYVRMYVRMLTSERLLQAFCFSGTGPLGH